ncbi:MAG TPA: hypothetical protein VJX73_09280 [Terracidiphilus sp.]|nr:hypothetical protein [Terracidiphilus sp.]
MRRFLPICLLACLLRSCVPIAAQQAPIPTSTALSGNPFYVKKSWPIGGSGNWDYLTMDVAARRLYIAHGHAVQVVDVDSGTVVGEIPGFRDAHAIALDDTGQFGFVSDGPADAVAVFNRRGLTVESTIFIGCSPRSIVFEPQSRLVVAVCGAAVAPPRGTRPIPTSAQPSGQRSAGSTCNQQRPNQASGPDIVYGVSHVVAIDAEKRSVIRDFNIPGDFRYAQADGEGNLYFSVGPAEVIGFSSGRETTDRMMPPRIARLDATGIVGAANRQTDAQSNQANGESVHFNASESGNAGPLINFIGLSSACSNPQGLAIDGRHQRLFLACDTQQFVVLDSMRGNAVNSLTTGPGDDVLAYDQERGLIFVANGGGYGSLTIIQQDANTDSYAVIQNLPTLARARTLAVDPSSGAVYLVTDLHGVDLTKAGGIGTLHFDPIAGSFQVMVVGH